MNYMEIILSIIGTVGLMAISIISYFLNRTMKQLDQALSRCEQNALDIAVLKKDHETKYDHLAKGIEKLDGSITRLTDKIEDLTELVNQK